MIPAYIDPGNGFSFFSLGPWLFSFFVICIGFILRYTKIALLLLKKKPFWLFLLLILAVSSGGILMSMFSNKKKPTKKTIVIGIDGLDPVLLDTYLQQGLLPNFAKLAQTGTLKDLATTNPAQSPVAWAAFATGLSPCENGIFDFIKRDPADYSLSLSLAELKHGSPKRVFKTETFWNRLSKKNIPAVIIAHPLTFPPDKISGRMLSGMGTPDILGTEGTFSFFTSDPFSDPKNTGGNVFIVDEEDPLRLYLPGPSISSIRKASTHLNKAFDVRIDKREDQVLIIFDDQKITLTSGKWSPWVSVSFRLSPFKKMKGIFKFYLVSTEPYFNLYASPIQFDPQDPLYPISYPKKYSKELAEKSGLFHTQGMPVDTWAVNENRLNDDVLLEMIEETHQERKKIFDLELQKLQGGLLFCYFGALDTAQHMFWRFIDPKHPLYDPAAPDRFKNAIRDWYARFDALLGEVLGKIKEDDLLIVISDHGFNTFRRAVHLNSWLRQNGYLALKDTNAIEGKPLLRDVNWSKTKAYAVGFSSIYLNLEGREKNGIVPREDSGSLTQEIADRLILWIDDKYRQPVVINAYPKKDTCAGPFAHNAPDLIVGFNSGYRASWQTALGACPVGIFEDNLKKWSGDHLFDPTLVPGVFLSNRKTRAQNISLKNLAEIILQDFDDKKPPQS